MTPQLPKPRINFRPRQLGLCSYFIKFQIFSPKSLSHLDPVYSGHPQRQLQACNLCLPLPPCPGTPTKSDRVYPSATCKCIKTPDLVLSGHQTLKAERLCNYEQTRTLLERERGLLIIRWGTQEQNKMIWVNQGVDSLRGQLPPS